MWQLLYAGAAGGRKGVPTSVQAHPLVLQYERAEKLTDLLIANNREHLAWAR